MQAKKRNEKDKIPSFLSLAINLIKKKTKSYTVITVRSIDQTLHCA